MDCKEKAIQYAEKYGIPDNGKIKGSKLYYTVVYHDYYQWYTVHAIVNLDTNVEIRTITKE